MSIYIIYLLPLQGIVSRQQVGRAACFIQILHNSHLQVIKFVPLFVYKLKQMCRTHRLSERVAVNEQCGNLALRVEGLVRVC